MLCKREVKPFSVQALVFTCLQYKTLGIGEIACNEQFLLFSQCFSTCLASSLLFSTNLKLLFANSFSLEDCKICPLEKVNSLRNDKTLDQSKLKAFADGKNKCDSKTEIGVGKENRKHSEKRRKCWLSAFSPFSPMFSKGLYPSTVKSWDCMVKG